MGVSRFNPHRKKNKSFYPLFAHLAQTGQILKSRNRPGNVHDSKGADAFLRELIGALRGQFGRSRKLEFRTDAAFFNEKILKRLERSRSEFAIKAPFWGDVLRFLSKKNDVWFPKLKPVPVKGTEKGETIHHGKGTTESAIAQAVRGTTGIWEMNLSEIVRSGAQMMLQYAVGARGDGGVGSKLL